MPGPERVIAPVTGNCRSTRADPQTYDTIKTCPGAILFRILFRSRRTSDNSQPAVGTVHPGAASSRTAIARDAPELSPEQNAAGSVHIASVNTSPAGVKARCSSQTCIAHYCRATLGERDNAKVIVVDRIPCARPQPARASAPVHFTRPAARVCAIGSVRGELYGDAGSRDRDGR